VLLTLFQSGPPAASAGREKSKLKMTIMGRMGELTIAGRKRTIAHSPETGIHVSFGDRPLWEIT